MGENIASREEGENRHVAGEVRMVRVGIGYDVHRFAAGRALILGGVLIESAQGLAGHSDADVLLHAIIDALLGAAALGDIGMHFPDTDETWKDADSRDLLRHVFGLIETEGYTISNVDAVVAMENPKLSPYIDEIRETIAADLQVKRNQISVKATTGERMGFVGREEGVAVWATCALTLL